MKRTEWLQETRRMRFEEAYEGWRVRRLTQEEAARLLGVHERTFRRYIDRYEEGGVEGLIDKRLSQVSHRRAPVDEVLHLKGLYRSRYEGWNVKHFHAWYRREGGSRSYSWVKNRLQEAGLVSRTAGRGKHRKRRERAPLPGMMLHQDGSTHAWVSGRRWDLIVTMDDATVAVALTTQVQGAKDAARGDEGQATGGAGTLGNQLLDERRMKPFQILGVHQYGFACRKGQAAGRVVDWGLHAFLD
jgi:transposase